LQILQRTGLEESFEDSSELILRKLQNRTCIGRSSDLLGFQLPSHSNESEQWIKGLKRLIELTAAGTVADFHGIPYYPSLGPTPNKSK